MTTDLPAHGETTDRANGPRRSRIYYLIDAFFLATALKSHATQWVRQRMPMGDVENPYFPGCTARQVDLHFSFAPGRIYCSDDVPWGWLLEHLGNSFGHSRPSAFLNGSELFFTVLILYAHLHVAYAVFRIAYLAWRKRL